MSALERLAHFAADIEYQTLPARIADKTRACLLYGLAVAVASVRVPLSSLALAANAQPAGAGDGATRLIDGASVGAGDAAFANAMLFHARIQEDAHPAGHVGVVVLPALLAQAQSAHSSGRDLLAAIAAGYEIALRIGRDHATQLSERGFRTTSVYGPMGAAPACARLRRADAAAVGQCAGARCQHAHAACGNSSTPERTSMRLKRASPRTTRYSALRSRAPARAQQRACSKVRPVFTARSAATAQILCSKTR